jgi:hypothetical protein
MADYELVSSIEEFGERDRVSAHEIRNFSQHVPKVALGDGEIVHLSGA